MMLAQQNQAVAITNMLLFGSTAPVDLTSALALGNAEILGGIVLSQLVRPGAPVIYGSTSCPMDMKTGVAAISKPETLIYCQAVTELARYYGLPSRTGGCLTDSHIVDAQAGYESALIMKTAMDCGVDYFLHAFGMMNCYMAASLEKWVLDEELVRQILKTREIVSLNETPDSDYVERIGSGGNYLVDPQTFKQFRKLYPHGFIGASSFNQWSQAGAKSALEMASLEVEARLKSFQPPEIDQGLAFELDNWISVRRKELGAE
jgi:trimethylamine--corrinoid protein Co-methyltransferase